MISPKKLSDIAVIYNGNSINKTVKKEKYMNDVLGWNYIGTKDSFHRRCKATPQVET